jgi:hypothetical protein
MADPRRQAGPTESEDGSLTESGTGRTREVVVVRRRRSKLHRSRNWVGKLSPRRSLRLAAVSAGVLLLMAGGLYLGLSWQP